MFFSLQLVEHVALDHVVEPFAFCRLVLFTNFIFFRLSDDVFEV
jgi:hypothetical protein